MGTTSSRPPGADGVITVSQRSAGRERQDPDLAALQRLPPVSPLIQPESLSSYFTGRRPVEMPALHARNVSALCREYAALSRRAAMPICENQRALAKKMSSVEALCARILYLMALRSTELTSSASTLREMNDLDARVHEVHSVVRREGTRMEALEKRLARHMHSSQESTADDELPLQDLLVSPGARAGNAWLASQLGARTSR